MSSCCIDAPGCCDEEDSFHLLSHYIVIDAVIIYKSATTRSSHDNIGGHSNSNDDRARTPLLLPSAADRACREAAAALW